MRWLGRSASAIAIAVALSGCGDDGGPALATDGTSSTSVDPSTSSTTVDPSTSTTGEPDESTSEVASSSETTAAPCDAGVEGCRCREDFSCDEGLACELNTCVACEAGTFACPCMPPENEGEPGICGSGLFCVAGLCATAPACPWRNNGECDEPRGTGACYEGTDPEDCEGMGTETGSGSGTGTESESDTESESGSTTGTGTDAGTTADSN